MVNCKDAIMEIRARGLQLIVQGQSSIKIATLKTAPSNLNLMLNLCNINMYFA